MELGKNTQKLNIIISFIDTLLYSLLPAQYKTTVLQISSQKRKQKQQTWCTIDLGIPAIYTYFL